MTQLPMNKFQVSSFKDQGTRPGRKSLVLIQVANQTRRRVAGAYLQGHLQNVLGLQKVRGGEWAITVVGDRAMAALHERAMNLATTTDVLTFDLRDRGGTSELDLDTVICIDEAARRARELGHSVQEELLLYAIHSLLHVCGYDDVTAHQAARMHRREDAILLALGVGPVFAKRSSKAGGEARAKRASRSGR